MFEFDVDGLNTRRLEQSFINSGVNNDKTEKNVEKLVDDNIRMIKVKNARVKFVN